MKRLLNHVSNYILGKLQMSHLHHGGRPVGVAARVPVDVGAAEAPLVVAARRRAAVDGLLPLPRLPVAGPGVIVVVFDPLHLVVEVP